MPKSKSPSRRTAKKPKSAPPKKAKGKKAGAVKAAASKTVADLKPDQHERLRLYEKKSKEERAIDTAIAEVERLMVALTNEIDAGKSELKSLKKQHVTLHTELRQVVRGEGNLFADANEPKAVTIGDTTFTAKNMVAAKPAGDTAWRSVRLDTLKPKIPPKKLQLLAEHEPTITTMGELADWQEKIVEAQAKYFEEHPRKAAEPAAQPAEVPTTDAPQKLPGADELHALNNADVADEPVAAPATEPAAAPAAEATDFTEDAIDQSTRETVAEIEHHLTIEVGRRTSGPWQSGYSLSIGKLERDRPIGISPTFPNREDAIAEAVDAVGGHIAGANGEIVGRAALKVAADVRWALENTKKTLAPAS